MKMKNTKLVIALALSSVALVPLQARALDLGGLVKKAGDAGGGVARDKAAKEVNAKLLAEGRKNQCSFKTDTDQLEPGCDQKLKKLANALVEAKKRLSLAGVTSYRFEVSGHTDTTGKPEHNRELSARRAAVIERELVARGVSKSEIISVGMGSDRPLVKPDDTPAKKAKNRRYELQVRF
jgi:outer membrane protein OmpA-like peptidoglycan-associated protein